MSKYQRIVGFTWSIAICMFLWTFFGLNPPPIFPNDATYVDLMESFIHFSLFLIFAGVGYSFIQSFFCAPYNARKDAWRRLLTWGVGLVLFQVSIFAIGIGFGMLEAIPDAAHSALVIYALTMWVVALTIVFKGHRLLMKIRSNNNFNSAASKARSE